MAGGFYLYACIQGKVYLHNIRDNVSTRKRGFKGFLNHVLMSVFSASNSSKLVSPKKDLNIERMKDGTEGH